jgi:hypothetical protein
LDEQANLENQAQAETLQNENDVEQPKGASALNRKISRETSYRAATETKIPDTQTPSCCNHKEMHKSILA